MIDSASMTGLTHPDAAFAPRSPAHPLRRVRMLFAMRLFTFMLVLLLGSLAAPASAQPQQQWTFASPLGAPRAGAAATVLDGKIYVLGGEDGREKALDTALRYDPRTERWETLPPMRDARLFAAALTLEGMVYVIGGRDAEGNVLDRVERYDPVANTWASFDDLRVERQGLVAVVRAGHMLVAGGSNRDNRLLSSMEIYDPAARGWLPFETAGGDTSGVEVRLTGPIQALGVNSLTVNDTTFAVAGTTVILDASGAPVGFSTLTVGLRVAVRAERDGTGEFVATRIQVEEDEAEEVRLTGAIEALGPDHLTVQGTTFLVDAATEIEDADGNDISLADLAVGMVVEVRGAPDAAGTLVATRIRVEDEGGDDAAPAVAFCASGIDLNVGDTFNIRDYIRHADGTPISDWSRVFFTYTEAGADDPTVPPDWNLAAFNAGEPVTITAEDAAEGTGNRGDGTYRVYAVRTGQDAPDDDLTLRIDDARESEVDAARCAQAATKAARGAQLNVARASFAAVTVNDLPIFLGGFTHFGPLDLVQEIYPNGAIGRLPPLPSPRGSLSAAAVGERIYAIGGRDLSNQVLADVQRMDLGERRWVTMPRLIVGRERSAAVAVDSVLYVIGGRDASGRALASVEALVVATRTATGDPAPPPAFALAPAYPNPFRTTTTLSFTVPPSAAGRPVRLAVYDLQGRLVARLVEGLLPPGAYRLPWAGRGAGGQRLSSGVYVVRLQHGDQSTHQLITVAR